MDFLSRLIGGVGATQARKVNSSNNPQHRLARFKKTYNQALQSWHKVSASKQDFASTESIRLCFQRLTNYLHDDARAPSPHLCLSFAASSQIFIPISQIALSVSHEDIVREAVAWFSALVDSDEENLLSNERFAETLLRFIDGIIGAGGLGVGSQTEGEILELIFGIAAKLRLETELLSVWFVPDARSESSDSQAISDAGNDSPILTTGRTFPLCYQFIGHVYHEGRAGDFARTGLLYLFESASHSPDLEEWIVSSDLPTLMASGLGALYSQLSRKLSIAREQKEALLILALSDVNEKSPSFDVDNLYSETFQARMTTFMSNLTFWQDILEHCRSREIRQTLIDHFQIFFLQQILYPSLLESSDIDGGSSVAVLTYIWRILDCLEHPDLLRLILNYLLALQDDPVQSRPTTGGSTLAEKRKQSLLSSQELSKGNDSLTPTFFSLVDLILASVQSSNIETVTAALRLVSTIHAKHHGYAYAALIRTGTSPISTEARTFGTIQNETDTLLELARDVGGEEGMDQAYENCLKDALGTIEMHVCSLSHASVSGIIETSVKGIVAHTATRGIPRHALLPEDSLMSSLFSLLETFYTNDVEINLELTNVITHLASCPYIRLEGWLVDDASEGDDITLNQSDLDAQTDSEDPTSEEAEAARITAFRRATRPPPSSIDAISPFFKILHQLHKHAKRLRSDVDDFDHLLASRKRAFQGASELEDGIKFGTMPGSPSVLGSKASPASSRASSRSRLGPNALPTPATSTPVRKAAPTSSSQSTPATSLRGRAITAITGKPRPASPLSSAKLSTSTSKAVPIPQSQRQISPSPRGMSLSPSKASRTLSPLKFSMNADDADGDEPERRNERQRFDARSEASAESSEEAMFERKIAFPRRRPQQRSAVSSATDTDDGASEASETNSARSKQQRKEAVLTAPEDDSDAPSETGAKDASKADTKTAREDVHNDSPDPDEAEEEGENETTTDTATLNHVLTNIVILQEFIMEIAALIQVRASLLEGEVRFL